MESDVDVFVTKTSLVSIVLIGIQIFTIACGRGPNRSLARSCGSATLPGMLMGQPGTHLIS
eukprot:2653105-Amphidinium_carterae.1